MTALPEATERFLDTLDPALAQVLALCAVSTKMCAKTLFPERFRKEFSPAIHDPIFELIDSGYPYVAIGAPRGCGKTSIVGLAFTARQILFNLSPFILYVSSSFEVAQRQTENLKMELLTNRELRALFGDVKVSHDDSGIDPQFSSKSWVAFGRTLVWPRGAGQQVRGVLFRNARPKHVIIDDFEDAETISNDLIRKARKEWFYGDLLNVASLDRSERSQFLYIDTLKHQDAMLEDLLSSKVWKGLRLELCGDDLRSNAPDFISDTQVAELYEHYREQGQLDVFAREFRNQPINASDAVFRQEYFKYYEPSELHTKPRIEFVVIVDPAKSVKLHSADSAIVGVGFDALGKALYVHDVIAGKMHPDELIGQAFGMCERLGAKALGVEVTSLNEFITQPIRNAMMAQGKFFELIELKPRGGAKKEERIAALAPYYRQGYVYHNRAVTQKLEQQLIAFPRSKLWDVMDAFAYIVEMLELGSRYFEPPALEDEEDDYTHLLETAEAPEGEWRYI